MVSPDPSPSSFQLQILPGDPRRPIRQLRLSRGGRRALTAMGLLVLAPVVAGWAVLPWLLYSRLSHRDVRVQVAWRAQHGDRLQRLVEQLGQLAERAEVVERRATKMRLLLELAPARPLPPVDSLDSGVEGDGGTEVSALAGPFAVTGRRGLTLLAAIESRLAGLDSDLDAVEAQARTSPAKLGTLPSIFPLGGAESVLVAGFGSRRNPYTQEFDFHAGIDVAAPIGTPVLAPADGVVAFAGVFDRRDGDWWRLGQVVALRHGDHFVTLFGHCDGIVVRAGQPVSRGQPIASVGKSGWSTTVHLHYEVRRRAAGGEWTAVEPRLYILDQSWDDEARLLGEASSRPSSGGLPLPRSLVR